MAKIRTTLTLLIFLLLFIAGLTLMNSYYSNPSPHLSQHHNNITVETVQF